MPVQEIDSMETALEMYEKLEDYLELTTLDETLKEARSEWYLSAAESEAFLKSIENGDPLK